jgi:hypothetical protein
LNGKPPPPARIKKLSARSRLNARLVKLSTARCKLSARNAVRPLSHALPNAKRDALLVKLRTPRESPRRKSMKLRRLRLPNRQKRKLLMRPLMLKTRKHLRLQMSLSPPPLLKLKPPRLTLKPLLKSQRKRLSPSARGNTVTLNLPPLKCTRQSKLRLLPKRRRRKRSRRQLLRPRRLLKLKLLLFQKNPNLRRKGPERMLRKPSRKLSLQLKRRKRLLKPLLPLLPNPSPCLRFPKCP